MIQSVVACSDYSQTALDAAVAAHFERLNVRALLKPGMRVLIKPNLVGARKPEAAATTHPAVIRAIAQWLRAQGVSDIVVADSPGGLYALSALDSIYAATGMKSLCDVAALNRDVGWQTVPCPEGFENRSFNLINPACEADLIINAAKLKTHSMTLLSAGVKNLFGCIPGLQKPEQHYRHPDIAGFSTMLIELARVVAPQITVLDAVDCMEGDGPTGGTVRHMGLTLASRDPFAQDWFAARLCGMNPDEIVMLRLARERGFFDPDAIELMGDDAPRATPPFRLPKTSGVDFTSKLPRPLRRPARAFLDRVLRPFPQVDPKKCVGCGKCAESCPPHIITIAGRKARFTRKGCISCFCCQEMCPVKAISVKRLIAR